MTISTTASSVTLGGDGVTTVFPFTFIIPASGDEVITLTDINGNATVLLPTLYTVSGFDNPTGGTVTYPLTGSPILSGSTLTISRILASVQGTSLTNQGPYLPTAVENALDYLTMLDQQIENEIGRVITAPLSDPEGLNYILPPVAARENNFLAFDGSGNVVVQPGPIVSSAELQAALLAVFTANPGLLPASVPSGTIVDFAGGTVPTGFLLCDGSSISTTAQPTLFAAIGYVYGGSGANFSLPACGGNVSVGVNGSFALASTGGEATHVLLIAEMPSHQHTDSGHTHGGAVGSHQHTDNRIFAGGASFPTGTGWGFDGTGATGATTPGLTINTGNAAITFTGGGGAHNNLQPYIAFNKIIKT